MQYISRLLKIADNLDAKGFFAGANIVDQILVLAASDKKRLELLFGTGKVYYRKNDKDLWLQISPTKLFDYIIVAPDLNDIWERSNTKRSDNASDYAAGKKLIDAMIPPPHNVRVVSQTDIQAIKDINEENARTRAGQQGAVQEEKLKTTPEGAWVVGALQEYGQLVEVPQGYVRKGLTIDSPDYLRCRQCKNVFPKVGSGDEFCPECNATGEDLYEAPFKIGARIRIRNFPHVDDVVNILDRLFGVTAKVIGNLVVVDSIRALEALKRLGFDVGTAQNDDYTSEDVWVSNKNNNKIDVHFNDTPLEEIYLSGRAGDAYNANLVSTTPATPIANQRLLLVKLADLLDEKNLLEEANLIDRLIKISWYEEEVCPKCGVSGQLNGGCANPSCEAFTGNSPERETLWQKDMK